MDKRGRKGGAFPHSGAAEPHGVRQFSANWDSLGSRTAPTVHNSFGEIAESCLKSGRFWWDYRIGKMRKRYHEALSKTQR